MNFELHFERTYPHRVADVWRAVTEPAALGEWLMENDFVPELGHEFHLLCRDADGTTSRYRCKLLELETEKRLLWSWVLEDRPEAGEMLVEVTLEAVPEGTRLRIRHSGDRDRTAIDDFEGGWPRMLEKLENVLRRRG